MADLSKSDINHIAKLADLELSESEIPLFQKQLASILDFVGKLKEVKTEGVEVTSQVTGLTDVFREDEIKNPEIIKEGLFETKLVSKKDA